MVTVRFLMAHMSCSAEGLVVIGESDNLHDTQLRALTGSFKALPSD